MKRFFSLRKISNRTRTISTLSQVHYYSLTKKSTSISSSPMCMCERFEKYCSKTTSNHDSSIGVTKQLNQHYCDNNLRRRYFASSSKKKKPKVRPKHSKKQKHPKQKQQKQKQQQKLMRRPPKLPNDASPKEAPPIFLYPTASPHVYISSIAIDCMNANSEEEEQLQSLEQNEYQYQTHYQQKPIHPNSFFTETNPPQSFTCSTFEYVSPKQFKHELPTNSSIPEVAFLGRSNVGKSSLLNAITGNSHLARISKTPGRTQQVNYFGQFLHKGIVGLGGAGTKGSSIVGGGGGGGGFGTSSSDDDARDVNSTPPFGYIVDLPGYGYAQAPDKLVDEWQKNTQDFILARKEFGTLERLYILVDAKRGIGVIDTTIMSWLDEACVNYTVVLTKSDSTTKPILIKGANEICMRYHNQMNDNEVNDDIVGYQSPFVHVTSSRKGVGVVDLMYAVEGDFHGFRL